MHKNNYREDKVITGQYFDVVLTSKVSMGKLKPSTCLYILYIFIIIIIIIIIIVI